MVSRSFIEAGSTKGTTRVRYRIDGQRGSLGLGKTTRKVARSFQVIFDELLEYKATGANLPGSLIEKVNKLDDTLIEKLVVRGLLPQAMAGSLIGFIDDYIKSRRNIAEDTKRKLKNERKRLKKYFGSSKKLHEVTELDAVEYREHLELEGSLETEGKGLAPAAVNRFCGICSQFFNAAIKKRLLSINPFDAVEKRNLSNDENFYFITREDFEKLVECVPRWQIRTALALGRYAGIRLPSEAVRLRWEDVHFGDGTADDPGFLTIENVKTKHHSSVSEYRTVPLFPELRPYLEEAYAMSEEGAEWVIEGVESFDKNRDKPTKPNLRTTVLKSRKKAGLVAWPDMLKNLRKTRQTELTNHFPQHVVCAWLGNSEKVAEQHYLHVTDGHMAAGSMVETVEKKGSNKGSNPSVMAHHAPSAKTVTLQKQAFPVTDRHDPSQEIPEWAMRDSNRSVFDSVKIGLIHILKNTAGPKAGPNQNLSQLTGRLIERWDSLTKEERLMLNLFIDWDEVMEIIDPATARC